MWYSGTGGNMARPDLSIHRTPHDIDVPRRRLQESDPNKMRASEK
jgi:hypothetical protein